MEYFTNDNWSYFDIKKHMYVLKPEYMRDNYSIELANVLDTTGSINGKQAVLGFLKRASMVLYNYIYRHHPGQRDYIQYRLVRYPEYRDAIMEALGELIYSWLINNNDLTIQNGISIDMGKLYDRIDAQINAVPVSVQNILYNAGITTRAMWDIDEDYLEDLPAKGLSW